MPLAARADAVPTARPETALSFAFTEADTPAVRERIERDLSVIAERVQQADPRLVALVLTGGFSRGEGTTRDGAPVNDYDLVAVRARPGGDARYARLGLALTRELGIEVDLLPVWRARLPRVGRKLFWLDLRLGGKVILGDPSVLSRIRAFSASQVARAEVARLLGNRAAGLLLALPGPGGATDARQRDLQATKAVLAAMDATLLHRGEYAPTLRERFALSRDHPHADAFALALEWKLGQRAQMPDSWWDEAADVLLQAVRLTGARGVRDGLVERCVHFLRARAWARHPSQDVRLAAWDLLALSRWPDGPTDLDDARRILARIGVDGPEWRALRDGFFARRASTLQ